jgi:hypothetical protein
VGACPQLLLYRVGPHSDDSLAEAILALIPDSLLSGICGRYSLVNVGSGVWLAFPSNTPSMTQVDGWAQVLGEDWGCRMSHRKDVDKSLIDPLGFA